MQTLYLDWFTQLSPLQKPSAALPLRSALAPTCTRTSLTKPGAAGTMKKPRWYCNPGLPRGFTHNTRARVAELADALASGASDRKVVEVRVLSRAPSKQTVFGTSPDLLRLESPLRIEHRRPCGWY